MSLYSGYNYSQTMQNIQSTMKNNFLDKTKVCAMHQVHGQSIQVVKPNKQSYICDALITDQKNISLMVVVADCIPLLLYDLKKEIIAVVHAGRNGTFLNIAKKTVLKMQEYFGCEPSDIQVQIGPSIGACCYEVSEELAHIAHKNFPKKYTQGRYIDLKQINIHQLTQANIPQKNITQSQVCTKCSNGEYFSYRGGDTSQRFAGVISMKAPKGTPGS